MKKYKIKVEAVPVAQPRPRAVSFAGRARMANSPKSHPVHDFKASVRQAWSQSYLGPPLDEPLVMRIVFVMPRPTAKVWKTKPMPREAYVAKKNDWDNLGKAVCDALNKFAYTDDGLIWRCEVIRQIASGDELPHVMIDIACTNDFE